VPEPTYNTMRNCRMMGKNRVVHPEKSNDGNISTKMYQTGGACTKNNP
jgi:hypothetical protein